MHERVVLAGAEPQVAVVVDRQPLLEPLGDGELAPGDPVPLVLEQGAPASVNRRYSAGSTTATL